MARRSIVEFEKALALRLDAEEQKLRAMDDAARDQRLRIDGLAKILADLSLDDPQEGA